MLSSDTSFVPLHGRGRPRGFTLVELLVVMSIIIVISALAVPVFNILTGARSIDGATNIVSSMLASARSAAISRQKPVGLAVYFDADKDRVALALVSSADAWSTDVNYERGDMVTSGTTNGLPVYWICTTSHRSQPTNSSGSSTDGPPAASLSYWNQVTVTSAPYDPEQPEAGVTPPRHYPLSTYISILPETEVTYLPKGVSAQVLANQRLSAQTTKTTDHYLSIGVIFFDAAGQIAPQQQWGILFNPQDLRYPMIPQASEAGVAAIRSSRLGLSARFNFNPANGTLQDVATNSTITTNLDPIANSAGSTFTDTLRSGLGILLYDRATYETQASTAGYNKWDSLTIDVTYGNTTNAAANEEADKEAWLDTNGTLLMINRYNGTLLKAE